MGGKFTKRERERVETTDKSGDINEGCVKSYFL